MKISSWTRHEHNTMPPASKTTGNYVNSSLAKVEALNAGYDEAIMLAPNGLVAECSGENVFVARNGILLTPPLSAGALEGITQNSVMTIARDLGFEARVDNIARSDLYIAEEMFVCGTAAEVSSVNSVDDRPIPCPGPMTKAIAETYARAVRGEEPAYKDWCELCRVARRACQSAGCQGGACRGQRPSGRSSHPLVEPAPPVDQQQIAVSAGRRPARRSSPSKLRLRAAKSRAPRGRCGRGRCAARGGSNGMTIHHWSISRR